jgi:leader peptidase (prepilin peptidase)/N-methyltransferase
MPWATQAAAFAALGLLAWTHARFPRALFAEAGEAPIAWRTETGLAAALFIAGALLFAIFPGPAPAPRFLTAALAMVCGAIVYADIRYLVIPDLYSAAIAAGGIVLNLLYPASRGPQGWIEMAAGAAVCGGLLGLVAFVWKRAAKVEGLGFGDVKLAAALGALLGPLAGVWAITVSAAGGAALGYALMARSKKKDVLLFPYGAPLALAGAGFLLWERAA